MYRQIHPTQNKSFVKQSEWSNSLKDLCKGVLQEEHNEQNRKEYERNICKVMTNNSSNSYTLRTRKIVC